MLKEILTNLDNRAQLANRNGDYTDQRIIEAEAEILKHFKEEVKKTEKAFGGCKKCYGKGYSTQRRATTTFADFQGDKTYTTPMKNEVNFCSCDRGKQLQDLLAKLEDKTNE